MSVLMILYSNVFDTSVEAQIALEKERRTTLEKKMLILDKELLLLKEKKEFSVIQGNSGILSAFDLLFIYLAEPQRLWLGSFSQFMGFTTHGEELSAITAAGGSFTGSRFHCFLTSLIFSCWLLSLASQLDGKVLARERS
jgi:hypothetical protein